MESPKLHSNCVIEKSTERNPNFNYTILSKSTFLKNPKPTQPHSISIERNEEEDEKYHKANGVSAISFPAMEMTTIGRDEPTGFFWNF